MKQLYIRIGLFKHFPFQVNFIFEICESWNIGTVKKICYFATSKYPDSDLKRHSQRRFRKLAHMLRKQGEIDSECLKEILYLLFCANLLLFREQKKILYRTLQFFRHKWDVEFLQIFLDKLRSIASSISGREKIDIL